MACASDSDNANSDTEAADLRDLGRAAGTFGEVFGLLQEGVGVAAEDQVDAIDRLGQDAVRDAIGLLVTVAEVREADD